MSARKSGVTDLPLHGGRAPSWLTKRMRKLSVEVFRAITDEYGADEAVRRLSDPFWLQALSCVLAYDWHSSGTTTVVCGVLKSALNKEETGVFVAGGKGKASMKTLSDIQSLGDRLSLSSHDIEEMQYASRIAAKVDNAAVQDGYQLYHHSMILSESGSWTVIQQGMNPDVGYARRYQWLSGIDSYVSEPHTAISGDKTHNLVLDMTSGQSESTRKTSTDLARERTKKLQRLYESIRPLGQSTLAQWSDDKQKGAVTAYKMPARVNWNALRDAYEIQPQNYEEVIGIRGVGPATVRALSLVSDLVYGEPPSWKDPVKYSFAFGGKDGVPYPVNRRSMDECTDMLKAAVDNARIGDDERLEAIRRLRKFADRLR